MSPEREDLPLRRFLEGVKAGDKAATIREQTERIIHEGHLREKLRVLQEKGFRVEEALVAVRPRGGEREERPDFIVQKEDILLNVYLALGQRTGAVDRKLIRGVWDVLNTHITVKAVVFVWPEETCPAVVMDAFGLRSILDEVTDSVDVAGLGILPVVEAIEHFYDAQFINWNIPEGIIVGSSQGEELNVARSLRELVTARVQEERMRRYEIPEKVEARDRLTTELFEQLVTFIIDVLRRNEMTEEEFDRLERLIRERAEQS